MTDLRAAELQVSPIRAVPLGAAGVPARTERALRPLNEWSAASDDSVVDVLLVERDGAALRQVCVRVPVTGAGITYWNQKRWSLGARMSWRRGLRFSRSSVLLTGISVARWWGPVRIGVERIIGDSSDRPSATGRRPGGADAPALAFWSRDPVAERRHRWHRAASWRHRLALEALGPRLERGLRSAVRADPARFAAGSPPARAFRCGSCACCRHCRRVPALADQRLGLQLYAAAAQELTGAAAGAPVTYSVSFLAFSRGARVPREKRRARRREGMNS